MKGICMFLEKEEKAKKQRSFPPISRDTGVIYLSGERSSF